ncbi:hypothetical protein BB561_002216 [Smittium simulii]|uniref:Uncharacterized protein n=1 Tax=Smittium simulii TaxID=133385 RepID=A0A2T9YR96_9FUNG|nr:hypothetical protein BB561_002216 [Smittium simulii]
MPSFIDIGANLCDPVYNGIYRGSQAHPDDFDQVLERAKSIGMNKIIITGGSLEESAKAIDISNRNPMLFATVGCHPTRSSEVYSQKHLTPESYYNKLLETIELGGSKVVAVGECGLDYDRTEFADIETQKKCFEAQFKIAQKSGLPLFLHNRNTGGDFVEMIKKNRTMFSTGVVHSFTSNLEEMQQCLDLDLYIGINGCSLKTEENLLVAKAIPEDRIMIETDCPYCDIKRTHASYSYLHNINKDEVLSGNKKTNEISSSQEEWWLKPVQKAKNKWEINSMVKGRNEPCTIPQVLRVLAKIKNIDEESLAKIIYENTLKVFFPSEAK